MTQWPPDRGWDVALALPESSTHHPQMESLRGQMGVASTHGAIPGLSPAQPALCRRQVDFASPGRRRVRCWQRLSPERTMAGR